MDHAEFKENQTAAGYVADGLDENTQEAFELHLMACAECVDDVEAWRAIKQEMPRRQDAVRPTAPARRFAAFGDWRMAASLVGAGVVGAAGGWLGRGSETDLDLRKAVIYNLPSVTRGAECSPVRLATDTLHAVLRVPGVQRDLKIVATDTNQHELPASQYSVSVQPDGSRLLQIDARALQGREVRLETRGADGSAEPVGCISAEQPPR